MAPASYENGWGTGVNFDPPLPRLAMGGWFGTDFIPLHRPPFGLVGGRIKEWVGADSWWGVMLQHLPIWGALLSI
jgi:hypothetical protein